MRNNQIYALVAVLIVASVGIGTAYAGEIAASAEVPRYAEECAHGHNGFDCNPPQYKVDIEDLQERVTVLERVHKNSP